MCGLRNIFKYRLFACQADRLILPYFFVALQGTRARRVENLRETRRTDHNIIHVMKEFRLSLWMK